MAYNQMAYYYDQLMQDAPYDKWRLFTETVIEQFGKPVNKIVDLGCGTGQITTRLAESGYQMIGVDYSSDMLSFAEQRMSYQNAPPVQWIQQDLRELIGIENQDMAISYCDVMNYITEEDDLNTVFANTAALLKPGGIFIFDVHALYHVENNMVNHTFAEVYDDISYIWFCTEGDRQGEMYHDLTFFVSDDNTYSRFDEVHRQRTFPIEFYERLLHANGFGVQHLAGDFSLDHDVSERAERIFITAVKRSE